MGEVKEEYFDPHYVYLLHPREFFMHNDPTLMIGKSTEKFMDMIGKFPEGCRVISIMEVLDGDDVKNDLENRFSTSFVRRETYGPQYYTGDLHMMINMFLTTVMQFNMEDQGSHKKYSIQKM